MQVLRSISALAQSQIKHNLKNSTNAVTLGNFDGFHRGHLRLVDILKENADRVAATNGKPRLLTLVSFYPHPRTVLNKINRVRGDESQSLQLMSFKSKCESAYEQGFDLLFAIRFTKEFSQITAEDFFERYLLKALNAKLIIVGEDWRFGTVRRGDINLLKELGGKHGIEILSVPLLSEGGLRVSSGKVKEFLRDGDLPSVEKLLGRPFSFLGKVIKGDGLGRTIGFRTANLHFSGKQSLPKNGVYVTEVQGLKEGLVYQSVTNIGMRPTMGGKEQRLEVHVFDNDLGVFYGKQLKVIFRKRLRDEKRFNSLAELKTQITSDIDMAREFFKVC